MGSTFGKKLFFILCFFIVAFCFCNVYASSKLSKPNLKAYSVNYNKVKLSWNKVNKASGYEVYRYNSKSKKYSLLFRTKNNSVYVSSGVSAGKRSYYKVRAFKSYKGKRQYGYFSKNVSVLAVPSSPSISKVSKYGNSSVLISWKGIKGASGYSVYKLYNGKYVNVGNTKNNYLVSDYRIYDDNYAYYRIKSYKVSNGKKIYSNSSKTYSYKVDRLVVRSISLDHSKVITEVSRAVNLKARISPASAKSNVYFKSSNEKVAFVTRDGVVIGQGHGKAYVTAYAGSKSVSIPVYVTKPGDKLYVIDTQDSDITNGDCMLIQSRNSSGNNVFGMIDTGYTTKGSRVVSYLKDMGIKRLDWVLISHFHNDHFGALGNIYSSGIKVKNVYIKKYYSMDTNYRSVLSVSSVREFISMNNARWDSFMSMVNSNSDARYVSPGVNDVLKLGNFKFKLYNTSNAFEDVFSRCKEEASCNENVNSIVALGMVRNRTFYLNADIENYSGSVTSSYNRRNYVEYMVNTVMSDNNLSKIDIVKAGHHGWPHNNPQRALNKLNGDYVFVTGLSDVLRKRRPETISRIKKSGVPSNRIYYSGDGTIVFNVGYNNDINVLQMAGEGCNKFYGC